MGNNTASLSYPCGKYKLRLGGAFESWNASAAPAGRAEKMGAFKEGDVIDVIEKRGDWLHTLQNVNFIDITHGCL